MFKRISLNYDFAKVLASDHDRHSDSCAVHQAKEMPDIYGPYNGHPKSYCLANTTIHQLWWDRDDLDFDEIGRQLDMEVVSISSIRQDPGNVIPYHRDMFFKITQAYPDRKETKVRANIFLEASKLGHILQFTLNNKHETFADWEQNQGCIFDSSVLHLSCNAGLEPKYTMQVSGFYLGN
jgi:hypothetical protein